MKTFKFKAKRSEELKTTEKLDINTGASRFRITLDVDGKLRINKVDKTEKWDHNMNINPASGNEIIIS